MFSKILVVDDQDADHLIAEYAIQDYNEDATILKAYDGAEALSVLSKHHDIDLILLDINMPGMNGHEFLSQYNEDNENSPVVVMLTSSDQSSDRERCEQYQFVVDYLTKPLEDSDLARIDAQVNA